MPYNLIRETWIPVRRASGEGERIAPWQLTDRLDKDPITELAAPRPDFDGALIQLLISLVQTAYAPETERDWRRGLTDPPAPETLREAFAEYEQAFNLDGDGPRFMQDFDAEMQGKKKEAAYLLIDSPSENALDSLNQDHFVKDRREQRYSEPALAAALYAYQANVPNTAAGQGARHQSSLRGGGPVTTLVLGANLWQTVWLNTVTRSTLENLYGKLKTNKEADIFPWLDSTRTSESKTGSNTTPDDAHPAQMYWGMPRRVRIEESSRQRGECATYADQDVPTFSTFRIESDGINYEGPWKHPLSPFYEDNDGKTKSRKVKGKYFSYRFWTDYVIQGESQKVGPALPVAAFFRRAARYQELADVFQHQMKMWVFGYETNRGKIRAWRESKMPLYQVPESIRARFEDTAVQLIEVAGKAAINLRTTLLWGLYGKPKRKSDNDFWKWELPKRIKNDQKIDQKTFLESADTQFWQDTEPAFYRTLHKTRDRLEGDEPLITLKTDWAETFRKAATSIFDRTTQHATFQMADPKTVALARRDLRRFTSPYSKKVRKTLRLPEKQTD